MAANILRSERAAEMSVYVVRAFVKQREALASNAVILKRLAEIDKTLLEHDSALQILWSRARGSGRVFGGVPPKAPELRR